MNDMHLTLHAAALKENARADEIAALAGLAEERANELLEKAVAGGRLVKNKDRYMLSPAARMILDNQYPLHYDNVRKDKAFLDTCEQFEALNVELKQCITDWQTREVDGEKVPNDHSDEDYDNAILDRLDEVQDKIETILDRLASKIGRLGNYKSRLESALEKAEGGEPAWVSDVKIDSYHTVWFQLHEDLLRILGRQREE